MSHCQKYEVLKMSEDQNDTYANRILGRTNLPYSTGYSEYCYIEEHFRVALDEAADTPELP